MVGAEGSTLDELRAEGRGRDEMPEEFKHLPGSPVETEAK
jgi:hypothetical protein